METLKVSGNQIQTLTITTTTCLRTEEDNAAILDRAGETKGKKKKTLQKVVATVHLCTDLQPGLTLPGRSMRPQVINLL